MSLNVSTLLPQMLEAAGGVLQERWPEVRGYAETEFQELAETLARIARLYAEGEITEERAKLLVKFQKRSARSVLLTIEGLGRLAAEQAINAALGVVRDTVNTAIGFRLL